MDTVIVNPDKFKFRVLPDYAGWVLHEKLDEYVSHSLQFSREEGLPLLIRLERYSPEELVKISRLSATELLSALRDGKIHEYIRENVSRWIANSLEIIDKDDVVAEDLTLVGFIRRKTLSCFLPDYTGDQELKRELLREIDIYTTQDELVAYNAYLKMQQEKMQRVNQKLEFQESLLLEAQEISEMGSFFLDYDNLENSVVSPQIERITGYSFLTDANVFFNHIHPDDVGKVSEIWNDKFSTGGSFEYQYRYDKDGVMKHFQTRGIIEVRDGKPVSLRGTLRDITKEIELIDRLTQSQEMHNQAQQLTHLGNWSWDVGSDHIAWSDEMFRIYGLEPQSEIITFDRFLSLIHPDDRQKRLTEIQESLATGVSTGYLLKIIAATGEHKVLRGYGDVIKDKEGNPVQMVGTCQDITREYRLNRELRALNKSLSGKNRELRSINRELELFNYIASHDLQEPLRKIQIYSGRVLEQADNLEERQRQSLQKVIASASRMQQLISDLIEFSQLSSPASALSEVSLTDAVSEARSTYSLHFENGSATIRCGELATILAVPFQIRQLLSNLIGNSIKYKKPGSPSEITIAGEWVNHEAIPDLPDHAEGSYYRVSVCDNGIGFDHAQKENIFGLFKRLHTSQSYSGTGIGLAICRKIAQNHDGFIHAESNAGSGACFHMFFPEKAVLK